MPQSEGAGAHGGNQVRIGIDDDHPQPARQAAHEAGTENFAGAHRKQVAEYPPRQNRCQHNRVEIALVIGGNNVRALRRKLFQPAHPQMKTVARKNLQWLERSVQERAPPIARAGPGPELPDRSVLPAEPISTLPVADANLDAFFRLPRFHESHPPTGARYKFQPGPTLPRRRQVLFRLPPAIQSAAWNRGPDRAQDCRWGGSLPAQSCWIRE